MWIFFFENVPFLPLHNGPHASNVAENVLVSISVGSVRVFSALAFFASTSLFPRRQRQPRILDYRLRPVLSTRTLRVTTAKLGLLDFGQFLVLIDGVIGALVVATFLADFRAGTLLSFHIFPKTKTNGKNNKHTLAVYLFQSVCSRVCAFCLLTAFACIRRSDAFTPRQTRSYGTLLL